MFPTFRTSCVITVGMAWALLSGEVLAQRQYRAQRAPRAQSVDSTIRRALTTPVGNGLTNITVTAPRAVSPPSRTTASPTQSVASRTRANFSVTPSRTPVRNSKPFSNIQPRSTVSPYLNLTIDSDATGVAIPTYQSIVRPQLEQQRFNQQQQREVQQLQRSVQQLSTGGVNGVPTTGDPRFRATGHPTAFMNLSHFYGR